MSKPTVFISHITEEAEIAGLFKQEIESRFLGLVNVFVSSDATSIKLGKNWLDEITDGLRNCAAMLLFCSPYSIRRPWINFECGAGWARDIEVAPICHSGLRPVDLPLPISLLQGVEAHDPNRIPEVFQMIAAKLGSQVPGVDGSGISAKVLAFENKYIEQRELLSHLQKIYSASTDLLKALAGMSAGTTAAIQGVPEQLVIEIRPSLDALQKTKHLNYSFGVNGVGFTSPGGSGGGNFGTLTISLTDKTIAACKSLLVHS